MNELYAFLIPTPASLRTILILSYLLNLERSKLSLYFRFSEKDVTDCGRCSSYNVHHPSPPSSFDHLIESSGGYNLLISSLFTRIASFPFFLTFESRCSSHPSAFTRCRSGVRCCGNDSWLWCCAVCLLVTSV
jgi:hypothetical protein